MSLLISPHDITDSSLHALLMLTLVLMLLRLRRWPLLFALCIWPGTFAHELLHYLAGWVAGAKPVSLSLIPRRTAEGGWVLGSVSFSNLRWWNSVPVSLAPLALLPFSAYLWIESISLPVLSIESASINIIAAQCLIAGWPSPRDWSQAAIGLLITGMVLLAGYGLMMKAGVF
jgi:hypothetical protein